MVKSVYSAGNKPHDSGPESLTQCSSSRPRSKSTCPPQTSLRFCKRSEGRLVTYCYFMQQPKGFGVATFNSKKLCRPFPALSSGRTFRLLGLGLGVLGVRDQHHDSFAKCMPCCVKSPGKSPTERLQINCVECCRSSGIWDAVPGLIPCKRSTVLVHESPTVCTALLPANCLDHAFVCIQDISIVPCTLACYSY